MAAKQTTKKKVTKKKTTTKTQEKGEAVQIPPIKKSTARITLEGLSPLMTKAMPWHIREEIEDMIKGHAKAKARNEKKKIDKEDEYQSCFYMINRGKKNQQYAVPVGGLKKAAVTARKYVANKLGEEFLNGCFHIVGDHNGLIPIKSSCKPIKDVRGVNVGNWNNKKPSIARRPMWNKWEVTFDVMYNSSALSLENLLNLYENAGFHVGLCENRPEKGGSNGMFRVKRK